MNLTVLVDNFCLLPDLAGEYGLSLHLTDAKDTVLMDTGQGRSLFSNARVLGIDLLKTDSLILSHGHFDHVGGVARFLTARGDIPIWAHPTLTSLHSRLVQGKGHFIGCHLNSGIKGLHPVNDLTKITENVWAVEVPEDRRNAQFLTRPDHLVVPGGDGQWKLDPFSDDISLVVRGENGLSVLLGCAHAGVVNIMEEVSRQFETRRFYAVVGGMHIGDGSNEFINRITDALVSRFTVSKWRPCHCTGFKAAAALAARAPDVSWAGAGTRLTL
ncbi:MAG: MBL fold metallo-hydrolase [Pseudomonadota bacterium]